MDARNKTAKEEFESYGYVYVAAISFHESFYHWAENEVNSSAAALQKNFPLLNHIQVQAYKLAKGYLQLGAIPHIICLGAEQSKYANTHLMLNYTNKLSEEKKQKLSCFSMMQEIQGYLTTMSSTQFGARINWQLDKYLLADSCGDQREGVNFEQALINNNPYNFSHVYEDSTNFVKLYPQIHRIASKNPTKNVHFNFYYCREESSSRFSIEDALKTRKHLLPKNAHFTLWHYNGVTPVRVFTCQGTGEIDFNYARNTKLLLLCGQDSNIKNLHGKELEAYLERAFPLTNEATYILTEEGLDLFLAKRDMTPRPASKEKKPEITVDDSKTLSTSQTTGIPIPEPIVPLDPSPAAEDPFGKTPLKHAEDATVLSPRKALREYYLGTIRFIPNFGDLAYLADELESPSDLASPIAHKEKPNENAFKKLLHYVDIEVTKKCSKWIDKNNKKKKKSSIILTVDLPPDDSPFVYELKNSNLAYLTVTTYCLLVTLQNIDKKFTDHNAPACVAAKTKAYHQYAKDAVKIPYVPRKLIASIVIGGLATAALDALAYGIAFGINHWYDGVAAFLDAYPDLFHVLKREESFTPWSLGLLAVNAAALVSVASFSMWKMAKKNQADRIVAKEVYETGLNSLIQLQPLPELDTLIKEEEEEKSSAPLLGNGHSWV